MLNTNFHIDYYEIEAPSATGIEDSINLTTKITTYDGCNYYAVGSACSWGIITNVEIDNGTMTVMARNPYSIAHTITAKVYVIATKA